MAWDDRPTLNINIVKSTSVTLGGRFTLADLRAFVAACAGLKDTATVSVTKYESRDQRDGSSTTITVNDA